ncbi:MAG: Fur family transcriptional regulator [Peptoniphilus sp.]|nr:Fur family transcriptional regulator [Peptoniphilus sp.]
MEELLKSKNLKVTKGRLGVLKIFYSAGFPLSTDEVYRQLNKFSNASLSTVYRIIAALEENNIIRKSSVIDGVAFYELNRLDHRHYIVCEICGNMMPIAHCPMSQYEKDVEQNTGFKVTGHIVELKGICPDCAQRTK